MSVALFVTHAAPTTLVDQVLVETERVGSYASSFFIAEPDDVCPLERKSSEGTKSPIPNNWQSRFLEYTPQQCSDTLKALVPEPVDEDDDEVRSSRRFAILDEQFTQSGKLLACNREEDDSVTSFRMIPNNAAMFLEVWSPYQWEAHLKLLADREASQAADESLRASRRAALARHFAES